jgi:hypothetical protein
VTDPVGVVPLPLSWRSHSRAGFYALMMLGFGVGALFTADGWIRWIGIAVGVAGTYVSVDYLVGALKWQYRAGRLVVPRILKPSCEIDVDPTWRPTIDDLTRRDSMFVAETPSGPTRVVPNMLVARSDIRQWLFLIGEQVSARPTG